MEEACHKLDLASSSPSSHDQGGISFSQYSSDLHQISKVRDDAERCKHAIIVLEQLTSFCTLTLPANHQNLVHIRKETIEQKKKLDEMVYMAYL